MSTKKTVKKTTKAAAAAAAKTVKRNGVTYTLITPSHLTKLKNDLQRAKAAPAPAKSVAVATPKAATQSSVILASSPATIPGTTGSTFNVFASSARGIAGIRNLGGESYRIRVVPAENVELPLKWETRPNGMRKHYSQVANSVASANELVAQATFALFAA